MRILCDQNVDQKYVETFEQESWLTVTTVRDELAADAPDDEVATYAAANDWVVFTTDDDFYRQDEQHGLLVYAQIAAPSPRSAVEAIKAINDAYENDGEITEVVPDGWA